MRAQCSTQGPFILTVAKTGYHPEQVTVGTAIQGGGTAGLVGNVVGAGSSASLWMRQAVPQTITCRIP